MVGSATTHSLHTDSAAHDKGRRQRARATGDCSRKRQRRKGDFQICHLLILSGLAEPQIHILTGFGGFVGRNGGIIGDHLWPATTTETPQRIGYKNNDGFSLISAD